MQIDKRHEVALANLNDEQNDQREHEGLNPEGGGDEAVARVGEPAVGHEVHEVAEHQRQDNREVADYELGGYRRMEVIDNLVGHLGGSLEASHSEEHEGYSNEIEGQENVERHAPPADVAVDGQVREEPFQRFMGYEKESVDGSPDDIHP